MRDTFFKTIGEIANHNDDIFILTGDLGFKLFDDFKTRYPERFYDVGVAESNMAGIAAGLALSGKNVYCYSIIPFLIMRAYEHIRVDIAYQNLNVKLVGVGGGFTYGLEGFTHYGLEDLALMRSLPNMTVIVPADKIEARCVAELSYKHQGPVYIRLGRTGEAVIHETSPAFDIGKAICLRYGSEVALFAIGNMVHTGIIVADLLSREGLKATLINMHTIKPLDTEIIFQVASNHKYIFTLEEHNVHGGLGSCVAEVLSEVNFNGNFKRFGIPSNLENYIGSADYLRNKYGLTPECIYNEIMKILERSIDTSSVKKREKGG